MIKKQHIKLQTLFLILWDIVASVVALLLFSDLSPWGFGHEFSQLGTVYQRYFWLFALISCAVIIGLNFLFRIYDGLLRFAGLAEAFKTALSVLCYTGLLFLVDRLVLARVHGGYQPEGGGMRITVFLFIAAVLFLLLILGRMSVRILHMIKGRYQLRKGKHLMKRVVIYGAGAAGNHYLNQLMENPEENCYPVCFLDDNTELWHKKVSGLRVEGGFEKLEELIAKQQVDVVVLAITKLNSELVRKVLGICKEKYVAVKKFALVNDLYEDTPVEQIPLESLGLRPINLEELLRRDSIHLNMEVVQSLVKDKVVLITGGCGSIGSEICRQVLRFGAKQIIIFDIHENGLFEIGNELGKKYKPDQFETVLGSVRDRERLREVMEKYHPAIVFHAAAHKHVPMMEINPREAIKNNVFGTVNTAQEAILAGCEKFILISTDKAVNPTNIMGASKRVAEMVIQMFDQMSDTDFAAVRFGNVLGSNGSVVPFFLKQIAAGGPVTVTHPDMKRYFMTIPEAVQLVLEAGAMAIGGEIFVLDMGEPVRIYDLACDLIKYSGMQPDKDIKILFTGLRPGEKLFEEISLVGENTTKTANDKIYINQPIEQDQVLFASTVKLLENSVHEPNLNEMFDLVRQLVDTFQHDETLEQE